MSGVIGALLAGGELLAADLPDLLALGRAVLDAIEQKSKALAVAQAAVAAADVAADAAEAAKFEPKP